MARPDFPISAICLDRRQFLASAALTAAACAGIGARITEAAEIIRVVPRQGPDSNVEGWNLGLISGHRPELTAADNRLRMAEPGANRLSRKNAGP